MSNDELTKEQADAVVRALDTALGQGPWDESSFLKVIGKKLRIHRDEFASKLNNLDSMSTAEAAHLANQVLRHRDQMPVYVALYSSNGKSIQSWEWIVTNLPRQMVSRPIYAKEEDIKAIINTKENKENEAYVIIYIDADSILSVSDDKVPLDKLGQPRLLLKDGALTLSNLKCFVHHSGTYRYEQGRLIKSVDL